MTDTTSPNTRQPASGMPSLTIDWEAYKPFLDSSDLSDAQKRELIETLWSIVVACVDLGFELRDPDQVCVSQKPECGGQNPESGIILPASVLGSNHTQKSDPRCRNEEARLPTSDLLDSEFRHKEES